MPFAAHVVHVLIASPSDVSKRRSPLREAIWGWNDEHLSGGSEVAEVMGGAVVLASQDGSGIPPVPFARRECPSTMRSFLQTCRPYGSRDVGARAVNAAWVKCVGGIGRRRLPGSKATSSRLQ